MTADNVRKNIFCLKSGLRFNAVVAVFVNIFYELFVTASFQVTVEGVVFVTGDTKTATVDI